MSDDKTPMISCYAYCRVSGVSQAGEGADGLPRQKAAIEAFVSRGTYEIIQTFEDAWTGKELDRPAFREMRSMMIENGVKTVIVEKLDRLSRDLLIQETIVGDFKKHGLNLVSTMEPDLCSDDPSRVLFRQLMGAIAQYDRAMLCARMRHGKDRLRREGKRVDGPKPYGDNPRYPGEIALVNRVNHLRRNGFNLSTITETLNSEGFRSRTGSKLFPAQISRIIRRA